MRQAIVVVELLDLKLPLSLYHTWNSAPHRNLAWIIECTVEMRTE
jgi:hypothetical protein